MTECKTCRGLTIDKIEILALKKLALICGALGQSFKDPSAAREQRALTSVLVDVINRGEIANARRDQDQA